MPESQDKLVRDMVDWFATTLEATPDESTVRRRVQNLHHAGTRNDVGVLLKPGERRAKPLLSQHRMHQTAKTVARRQTILEHVQHQQFASAFPVPRHDPLAVCERHPSPLQQPPAFIRIHAAKSKLREPIGPLMKCFAREAPATVTLTESEFRRARQRKTKFLLVTVSGLEEGFGTELRIYADPLASLPWVPKGSVTVGGLGAGAAIILQEAQVQFTAPADAEPSMPQSSSAGAVAARSRRREI